MSNRRAFITLLGGAAAWPLAARAQQRAMPVVGFVGSDSPDRWATQVRAFQQGLRAVGYVEGGNVAIEYRWAEGQNERLSGLVIDLLRRPVSVLAVPGTPAALAAKVASTMVPIVFAIGADPVQIGLVASLKQPGGNVTGVVTLNVEIAPKRLELLHELFPTATNFALLVNPTNPAVAERVSKDVQAPARTLGIKLHVLRASSETELDTVLATAARLPAFSLVVCPDPFFSNRIEQLAALTIRHALPAVYEWREFTAAGGLLSYGNSRTDIFRQAGIYTGRILKGEKPADLPVQQATKVEMYINLKTARALGITIPLPLSGRADEIFE